ncbi:MAG: FG-GAP repeat protein [Spirochaetales bacterium]|nr:FG-GAP repeat protein [Spirochaetales bacterium]
MGDPIDAAGAAYIFNRTGTDTWDSGVKIVAPDAQANVYFGSFVSLSGDYAIAGAFYEDGGPGDSISNAGAAYLLY